ncbi:MAG: HEAT repeat domain-containing protein [Spirochaetota bacterium]
MKKEVACAIVAIVLIHMTGPGFAQGASQATGTQAASSGSTAVAGPEEPDLNEKRQAIVKYGIESELLELFGDLSAEKNGRFNEDTRALFIASRSVKLRTAVLELWKVLAWSGGESTALDVVQGRDNQEITLVASCLRYLAEIKSRRALEYAKVLLDENDKTILPQLFMLLGRAGGGPEEDILLDWMGKDTGNPAFKESAIKALGEIKSQKAVDALVKIVDDSAQVQPDRLAAVDALGKIGNQKAVASLVKASTGDSAVIQAAAIEALGAFTGADAEAAILDALRSSFPKTRIAACKAVATRKLTRAEPNLEYKAKNDPDKAVKTEALRALSRLGGPEAFAFIAGIMNDRKLDSPSRGLAFGLLARNDPKASMQTMSTLLSAEAKTPDRYLFKILAKEVANARDAPDIAPLARILMADKEYEIRIGGLEWARLTGAPDIKADVTRLSVSDSEIAVRKRAASVLKDFP